MHFNALDIFIKSFKLLGHMLAHTCINVRQQKGYLLQRQRLLATYWLQDTHKRASLPFLPVLCNNVIMQATSCNFNFNPCPSPCQTRVIFLSRWDLLMTLKLRMQAGIIYFAGFAGAAGIALPVRDIL